MPELPEVEIIKRDLISCVLEKQVNQIETSGLNLHGKPIPDLSVLINQSFKNIYRRNKFLILETEQYFLVIHLGMTGQLIFSESLTPYQKHRHIVFHLSNAFLSYHDIRRFGMVQLYSKINFSSYENLPPFLNLGYEPLSEDFTLEVLKNLIAKSKAQAKKFIMDGTQVCGLGNIYACEVLFLSHINPEQQISTISEHQKQELYQNIKKVLQKSIDFGGSTISDYVHLNGSSGKMQEHYYVYGRENQACKCCKTFIKKIKQQGRSTFYCPTCQA